jgi:hypothetical protein
MARRKCSSSTGPSAMVQLTGVYRLPDSDPARSYSSPANRHEAWRFRNEQDDAWGHPRSVSPLPATTYVRVDAVQGTDDLVRQTGVRRVFWCVGERSSGGSLTTCLLACQLRELVWVDWVQAREETGGPSCYHAQCVMDTGGGLTDLGKGLSCSIVLVVEEISRGVAGGEP